VNKYCEETVGQKSGIEICISEMYMQESMHEIYMLCSKVRTILGKMREVLDGPNVYVRAKRMKAETNIYLNSFVVFQKA
jgi:hypothetical protein